MSYLWLPCRQAVPFQPAAAIRRQFHRVSAHFMHGQARQTRVHPATGGEGSQGRAGGPPVGEALTARSVVTA